MTEVLRKFLEVKAQQLLLVSRISFLDLPHLMRDLSCKWVTTLLGTSDDSQKNIADHACSFAIMKGRCDGHQKAYHCNQWLLVVEFA